MVHQAKDNLTREAVLRIADKESLESIEGDHFILPKRNTNFIPEGDQNTDGSGLGGQGTGGRGGPGTGGGGSHIDGESRETAKDRCERVRSSTSGRTGDGKCNKGAAKATSSLFFNMGEYLRNELGFEANFNYDSNEEVSDGELDNLFGNRDVRGNGANNRCERARWSTPERTDNGKCINGAQATASLRLNTRECLCNEMDSKTKYGYEAEEETSDNELSDFFGCHLIFRMK